MAYDTVFRISKNMLEDGFLRESDLEKLTKYNIIYFVRNNNNQLEHNVSYSKIAGPYERKPIINPTESSKKEVIKKFIPVCQTPTEFEQIEFAGLTVDYTDFIRDNCITCEHTNPLIKYAFEISSEISEKIESEGSEISDMFSAEYDTILKSSTPDYLLEFKRRKFPKLAITLNILGKSDPVIDPVFTPSFLMAHFGLTRLVTNAFTYLRIQSTIDKREGMAYNLSLDKKDISNVLKSETVII